MQPIYQAVVDDIDKRIGQLQAARIAVLEAAGIAESPVAQVTSKRSGTHDAKKHARPTGTEALLLEALKGEPLTINEIAKDLKVSLYAAQKAIAGQKGRRVEAVPKTWPRKYRLTK